MSADKFVSRRITAFFIVWLYFFKNELFKTAKFIIAADTKIFPTSAKVSLRTFGKKSSPLDYIKKTPPGTCLTIMPKNQSF